MVDSDLQVSGGPDHPDPGIRVEPGKVCFEPSGPYRPELIPVSVALSD